MTTNCYAMVRGSAARFTLLDQRGAPIQGSRSVVTTKGISKVSINESVDTQPTELMRNEVDSPRVLFRSKVNTVGYTAALDLIGVDPDLISFLTGQPVVANSAGDLVGNDALLHLPVVNFAMEIWSKLAQPVNGYTHGYTLFPRLRGGRVSGFAFSNSAVSFSVTGARTYRMSRWGLGPHALRWTGGGWDMLPWDTERWDEGAVNCGARPPGDFDRLPQEVGNNLHWKNFLVDYVPMVQCGAQPLSDVIDNGSATNPGTDVIDGQFVVTSRDMISGGWA